MEVVSKRPFKESVSTSIKSPRHHGIVATARSRAVVLSFFVHQMPHRNCGLYTGACLLQRTTNVQRASIRWYLHISAGLVKAVSVVPFFRVTTYLVVVWRHTLVALILIMVRGQWRPLLLHLPCCSCCCRSSSFGRSNSFGSSTVFASVTRNSSSQKQSAEHSCK